MGLPDDWNRVESWIRHDGAVSFSNNESAVKSDSKWPDIPVLQNYDSVPGSGFWKSFPCKSLPTVPESSIDADKLEAKIEQHKSKLTVHQYERSMKAVDFLKNGAPSHQTDYLPSCFVKNSPSAFKHGRQVTESIASWVAEGYAAGPFDSPPCKDFRVNPLIAVVQPGKVRVVLNVSAPEDESFNSNVDECETESVKMASAKQFAHLLMECGKDSIMSKQDLKAAYKQLPAKIADLRLQGFFWLGKFFVETRQVFGAKTSVCNYDILGETLKQLALLESIIPSGLVLRQVDDVPCVSPESTGWCEDFTECYKDLCSEINVALADDCPLNEKAFTNQSRGKVLGIMFDATDLTWRVPDSKIVKCLNNIYEVTNVSCCYLKTWQKLLGRLNDISQLCSFMKCFKQTLNECISGVDSSAPPNTVIHISDDAKRDLKIWVGFLTSEYKWLPLGSPHTQTPLRCREFVSDAAGLSAEASFRSKPGVGNVGFNEDGEVIFAHQFLWPKAFITKAVDENGIRFGDKTTTLEVLGLLMPFVLVPELLVNQHVSLKVDCYGTVFGMWNRYSKGDRSASVFIRAIYLVAAYLECTLHVDQLPRVSDWGAQVTDRLSRASTTTVQDSKLVKSFSLRRLPQCIYDWFEQPTVDWTLPVQILDHVKSIMTRT